MSAYDQKRTSARRSTNGQRRTRARRAIEAAELVGRPHFHRCEVRQLSKARRNAPRALIFVVLSRVRNGLRAFLSGGDDT